MLKMEKIWRSVSADEVVIVLHNGKVRVAETHSFISETDPALSYECRSGFGFGSRGSKNKKIYIFVRPFFTRMLIRFQIHQLNGCDFTAIRVPGLN